MRDFALTDSFDIDVSGEDLFFVYDIDQLAQNLKIRLQTFLAEWYLNIEIGVPYFQEIFKKNPNEIIVTNYIKKVIKETEGILNILSFSFSYNNDDPSIRGVSISFTCDTIYTKNYTFNINVPING